MNNRTQLHGSAISKALEIRLQAAADRMQKARQRVQQAQEQKAAASRQYNGLVERMAVVGVTPATIGAEIAGLEAQLQRIV